MGCGLDFAVRARRALTATVVAIMVNAANIAGAEPADPLAGTWMVRDEGSGVPRALIRIVERDGEYVGTIEQSLRPDAERSATCDNCPGERRGQPLLGMAIVTGMRKVSGRYAGGEILDPDSGQLYSCTMALRDGGRRLEVRGFIGMSLFGRSQFWHRAEP